MKPIYLSEKDRRVARNVFCLHTCTKPPLVPRARSRWPAENPALVAAVGSSWRLQAWFGRRYRAVVGSVHGLRREFIMLRLRHYAVDGERVVEVVLRVVLLDPQVCGLLQQKRVLLRREQVLAVR